MCQTIDQMCACEAKPFGQNQRAQATTQRSTNDFDVFVTIFRHFQRFIRLGSVHRASDECIRNTVEAKLRHGVEQWHGCDW